MICINYKFIFQFLFYNIKYMDCLIKNTKIQNFYKYLENNNIVLLIKNLHKYLLLEEKFIFLFNTIEIID